MERRLAEREEECADLRKQVSANSCFCDMKQMREVLERVREDIRKEIAEADRPEVQSG